jgi:hypothetical protein
MKALSGLLLGILLSAGSISSLTAVAPVISNCLRDLETNFFETNYVQEALSLYEVPQGLWGPITQDLQRKSIGVPERMKKRSENMVPNPLEYPVQPEEVARLLRATLYEVYMETMNYYGTNERPSVDLIFAYIFNSQMPKIERCLGKKTKALAPKFY